MSDQKNLDDLGIKTDEIKNILLTIKKIKNRMKDPEISNLSFIKIYDKLSYEFDDFFNTYPSIFTSIVRNEDLTILISSLYYKDKIKTNEIAENDLAEYLSKKFLPTSQK